VSQKLFLFNVQQTWITVISMPHSTGLQNALLKKNADNEHVKTGMTETFRLRRATYLSPAGGKGETTVKKIYADFPAFQQYQFVSKIVCCYDVICNLNSPPPPPIYFLRGS